MNIRNIMGTLKIFFSLPKLVGRRCISFIFPMSLLLIKILRAIGVKYFVIPYNKGLRYLCPLDQACDWYHITAETLCFNGAFEPKEGEVVIDVGANIGIYSMYCAQKVGSSGTVIAIEPEPRNFAGLLHNISLNKFSNIIAMNLALADHTGKIKLFLTSPTSFTIVKSFASAHWNGKGWRKLPFVEVPCKTLDDIISELGISNIDLLNMDVESAALSVLKGGLKALKKGIISKIKIEIEDENQVKQLSKFLCGFSYKVFRCDVSMYAFKE